MPMTKICEKVHTYKGYHGCASHCHVLAFKGEDGESLVIATEMISNPGTSITNRAETIADAIARELSLDIDGMRFVERWTNGRHGDYRPGQPERFRNVIFTAKGPSWRDVAREDLAAFAGLPIPLYDRANEHHDAC